MGRKSREMHPNAILTTSIYTGLAALVRLARKRVDKKTRKYLESILKHWNEARTEQQERRESAGRSRRDFSPIKNAEANLRKLFLKILWHSTRHFGNKEFKRVYSWKEGTVGPLNALLNYFGARLRDLAMTRYPFPEPEKFQIRKYPDGTKLTIQKKYVSKYLHDEAEETYWKAGYKGNRKFPTVLLTHPSLPRLDFVDMIRAHGVELVRQCFIHNVPRSDAHRYIRRLIHRLVPFLDYVYTEGKSGRNYFEPEADKELRKLVLEIRSLFSGRVGRKQSITKGLNFDIPEPSVDILWAKVIELIDETQDEETRERYSKILDHIDQGRIVDRDIEKLFEQVLALAQKEGNDWHRILLSDLHHPKSVKSVIFAGDKMLDRQSSVLIVGELPVTGHEGKGSIDLAVFIRRNFKGLVFWVPVMIIEIKSKTSFDFNLYAIQTDNKKDCPPALYAWKRVLTPEEWERTIESNPGERVLSQLRAYEKALLDESKRVIPTGVIFPKELLKGVIVLDTDQNYSEVFKAFHTLLDELATEILTSELNMSQSQTLVLDSKDNGVAVPRIALILYKGVNFEEFFKEQSAALSFSVEDPFKERVTDDRLLTHYISIPSSTSFGNAAAWVSRNWHLLNHIEEVSQVSSKIQQVHWLDLLGDYPTDQLMKRRFGLDILLKKKQITRERHKTLTSLLENITFLNLRNIIDSFLSEEDIELQEVIEQINVNETLDSERIIIVDRRVELKQMFPPRKMHILRNIENRLLDTLPTQDVNVIWIDNGVSHTKMNKHYQRACIKPLRHDSPRRFHIDEIIYNVPTAPRIFGWQTPRKEDSRFIIQDTPTKAPPWIQPIRVPHLRGWARKYRGLSIRDGVVNPEEVYGIDLEGEPMYGRSVTLNKVHSSIAPFTLETVERLQRIGMTLLPSLSRHEPSSAQEKRVIEEQWLTNSVDITANDSPLLTERMTFDPNRPPPQPPKSKKRYVEFSKIKRGWYYDRTPIDPNDREYEVGVSRRPPMYRRTGLDEVDSLSVRKREIKRLMSTAKFLLKRLQKNSSLFSCCRDVVRTCADVPMDSQDEKVLLIALQELRNIILQDSWRTQIWSQVKSSREKLGDVLTTDNRAVLKMAQELCPDITSLYGNNLFLSLLTVIKTHSLRPSESVVTALWESLAEWQLYQMGFRPMDHAEETVQSQYDFQFIYSKLISRVEHLKDTVQPLIPIEDVTDGQLVWIEKEGIQGVWIVLPDDDQPLIGHESGVRGHGLKLGWHQCVTDPSALRTSIRTLTDTSVRGQIALISIGETRILWFIGEVEGKDQWTAPVVLEYATSKEDGRLLRWFKLSPVPESLWLELEKNKPRQIPRVDGSVDSLLFGAFKDSQEIEDVKAEVSVDIESEHYRLKFSSGDSYEIRNTHELIGLLKHPYLKGAPLRTDDGRLLFWDHKKDIEYSAIVDRRREESHVIFLSFLKPLIHRVDLFSLSELVPKTCADLLNTSDGGTITLVAEVDEVRRNGGEFNYIKVKLKGLPKKSQLKALEDEWMNPYDLELLVGCEELVDASIGNDFTLETDVSQLRGVRLPSGLAEDSQLVSALSHYDEEDEGEVLSLPEGEWILSSAFKEGAIRWSLDSPLASKPWMDKTVTTKLNGSLNLEEMIEEFVRELEMVGASRDNIFNYDEELDDIRERLRVYGWGDEKPKCRAEAEQTGVKIRITLMTDGENEVLVYEEEFTPSVDDDAESVIDVLDGWAFSEYTIGNKEEFRMMLNGILEDDEMEIESVDREEAELLTFIEGYQEEGKFRIACAQTNLLVEYYVRQDRFDVALEKVEGNISQLITMDLEDENVKVYLFIARVLKAEILMVKNNLEDSRKEIEKAFEVLPAAIKKWKVGLGTGREYYERGKKLRNDLM